MVALYRDPSGDDIGGMVMAQRSAADVMETTAVTNTTSEKRKLQRRIQQLETRLARCKVYLILP